MGNIFGLPQNDDEEVTPKVSTSPYETIIIIHGVNDGAKDMYDLRDLILKHHPDSEVVIPDLFEYAHSITNMWMQVKSFGEVVKKYSNNRPRGLNIIGFSQGGLIARGVIQTIDGLNINSFVALSSPLNGQFGDTSYLSWLPEQFRSAASLLFYSPFLQHLSVASYWKDPEKLDCYQQHCEFLAPLNNESTNRDHKKFEQKWKDNFVKVKRLVLIGGKNDGVITPWQSALFGDYDKEEIPEIMKDLKIYQNDVFGLKTLDEAGKIYVHHFSGIEHVKWHGDEAVFTQAILPYLN